MKFEKIGDWCKWLERNFSPEQMIPSLPVVVRLDGNNFSSWTKGLTKPFDERLSQLMVETTQFLVKETNAVVGYTQSDEITLILYSDNKENAIYHEGKKQKIISKLTAKCVNFFNTRRKELLPAHNKVAVFDARIYQTPTLRDVCLQLVWRENDAVRNSISMLGYSLYPHNELQHMHSNDIAKKILDEKNVDWSKLPINLRRGTYVRSKITSEKFTTEELSSLPPKHNAHKNPDTVMVRRVIEILDDFQYFKNIENREDYIFKGESPKFY